MELELLAPAKDLATGIVAIDCGADAVYIGGPAFGARAAASNSIEDIAELVKYAHRYGAKVYVTMNTILFDHELAKAKSIAEELAGRGVDALIVQDMAFTAWDLPIALHASTQCDIRTVDKAVRLARAGMRRLVLPREFTPDKIREVRDALQSRGPDLHVPLEVFIHGARCVSYSGDCQMGFAATGRSANRGECPQMCRLPFDLVDEHGRAVGPRRHYLSLSDMATPDLTRLIDAGASSFKIEGRLKDRRYVANTVAWYSARLDKIVEQSGGRYRRSSFGRSYPGFVPDISKGFFRRPNGGGCEACLASPNDTGIAVGRTVSPFNSHSRSFKFDRSRLLANGDGLGYFDKSGAFCGFRLNRVAGSECFPASTLKDFGAGTVIYRNADKTFNDTVDSARPVRRLRISFTLSYEAGSLTLSAVDEAGRKGTASVALEADKARTAQEPRRREVLERLGDTIFEAETTTDTAGDIFVPASMLTALRRRVLESVQSTEVARVEEIPGRSLLKADEFAGMKADFHDNVANSEARDFYESHGAEVTRKALECGTPAAACGKQVMATRYCLRRELGACLKENPDGLPRGPLFLRNESGTYRLDFDCRRCGMNIIKTK